ncbi:MAG: FecR domain-containing protein [Paludibacter sp.]|nr:FecR domain-containing protein [Paludibacter sp.]
MKYECFNKYTAEDLILDKDFIDLVRDPDKKEELNNLIESFPEKRYEINLAAEVVRGLHVKKFKQSAYRQNVLWNKVVSKQKKQIRLTYLKYAAAVLLLIGAASTFYFLNTENTEPELVENSGMHDELSGDEDNVMLVLSNGKPVSINTKESTVQFSEDGTEIKVNEREAINQYIVNEGFNKMVVPFGKRSTVTLSDGTKVWLNSGSTLIFPPVFQGNSREVELIGEAFFDVTHKQEKPFFVNTASFEMKVYGTKFDIQSYSQDNASSVVLVEGLVSMRSKTQMDKEVFLAPSQRASIVDGSNKIQIDDIENVEEYTSWTEGYLSFSEKDLTHILKQISRYYNVKIDVDSTKDVDKIYGKLDLKDDIEKVLDGISFISNTKYKKIGDRYEFYQ